jgi:hypothetical protein
VARQVDIGLRDLRGQHRTIMLVTSGVPEPLELFWSRHFSQSVGRIDGTNVTMWAMWSPQS